MSKRSERRKAQRQQQTETQRPAGVSEAQLAANRANAQKSTGPVTPTAKPASNHNSAAVTASETRE